MYDLWIKIVLWLRLLRVDLKLLRARLMVVRLEYQIDRLNSQQCMMDLYHHPSNPSQLPLHAGRLVITPDKKDGPEMELEKAAEELSDHPLYKENHNE